MKMVVNQELQHILHARSEAFTPHREMQFRNRVRIGNLPRVVLIGQRQQMSQRSALGVKLPMCDRNGMHVCLVVETEQRMPPVENGIDRKVAADGLEVSARPIEVEVKLEVEIRKVLFVYE